MNQALPARTISLGSNADTHIENARLSILCGERHSNIKIIEEELLIKCYQQGSDFVLQGKSEQIDLAEKVLNKLYQLSNEQSGLEESKVYQIINNMSGAGHKDTELTRISTPFKQIIAKSKAQTEYLNTIDKFDVVFGIGPAGTGKTYLAVAKAVEALVNDEVNRIVLIRPVVEAGEHLGFLPGDIGQKIDPYLRPLYDGLNEMLGSERVAKLIEKNAIELAPLAYMRGRTLSDAFVILDEAQNTTVAQMKMLLTRIGFGAKVVLTGDVSQVDLPKGAFSGLKHALTILEGVKGIGVTKFTGKDIVRHPLVQRIVEAYEKHHRHD